VSDAVRRAREWVGLDGQDYASKVTCEETYRWDEGGELPNIQHDLAIAVNRGSKR